LVLAGLLMLAALLFPAYNTGLLQLDPSADIVGVSLALGFALGVVVDRSADTILDRWLGALRLKFALKEGVLCQRKALISDSTVHDIFPENGMRVRIQAQGNEGTMRAMEILRTRVRVARNMVVLTPVLTLSAVVGTWPWPAASALPAPALTLPFFEIAALTLTVLAATCLASLEAPRTDSPAPTPSPSKTPCPTPCYFLWSAATIWIVLHLVAACVAAICVSADPVKAIGACLAGVLLTGLAFLAWERITRSFMALLWDTCRFTDPEALAALLKGQIPARMKK